MSEQFKQDIKNANNTLIKNLETSSKLCNSTDRLEEIAKLSKQQVEDILEDTIKYMEDNKNECQ